MPALTLNNNEGHTHRLEVDVLMTDGSNRHIEVSFNGWQSWQNDNGSPMEIGNSIRNFLSLGILKDQTTIGFKATLHNIATGKKACEYTPQIKSGYGGVFYRLKAV